MPSAPWARTMIRSATGNGSAGMRIAIAITILIPALPFPVALLIIVLAQGALGIFGYEAIHQFERWMAIVLGAMFVVLTLSIAGQADTSLADGFSGVDQIGAFIAYV